eukprot:953430-Karenia_brevis.AAC.1
MNEGLANDIGETFLLQAVQPLQCVSSMAEHLQQHHFVGKQSHVESTMSSTRGACLCYCHTNAHKKDREANQ